MQKREEAKRKAKELVSQMDIFEKASQLRYDSPAIPRLKVPAYNWWNEALHGVARAGTATVFPVAIAMAAMFDEEMMRQVGDVIATEGRAKHHAYAKEGDTGIYKGLTFWSPNINLFRDPRWGRGHETYGEDPYLTGTLGASFIKGLQGEDENYLKSAACVKHLAAHSGPEVLRHEINVKVSKKDLWESYLPAFEMCVKEGNVEGVMGGYNRLNDEPCCGSYFLMRDVLRGKWGFEGYFASDCWALRDFHEHHMVTATPAESAALALHTGCDINCGSMYLHLIKALTEGLVTEDEITTACERAFTTRYLLGCFDETPWDQIPYSVVDCKEHQLFNEEVAKRSMVLLKNNGTLPLQKSKLKTIGVIGPNADSRVALHGNYHGTSANYITILEGITREVSEEVAVLYSNGCELKSDRTERLALPMDRISEAVIVAKQSDVVVLCVGLDETIEGEAHHISTGEAAGGDKEDLLLPEVQRTLIEEVLKVGKPTILCLMAGSAIDLSEYENRCEAILMLWYPGARGGSALAQILFGKESPSGKLPITFYGPENVLPEFTDYSMKNRTYRYIEEKPLYPFGYGLSYGNVICKEATMLSNGVEANDHPVNVMEDQLQIHLTLQNESDIATRDVIQVYCKNHDSLHAVRNVSLCAFKSITIGAWKKEEFNLTIPKSAFFTVDEEGNKKVDGSRFSFYIGTQAPDERSRELTDKRVLELQVNHVS